jgi:4-nitrophenyl phosphatase
MTKNPIKAMILDMDGVLWRADAPIGDLPTIFQEIEAKGIKVAYATNNSTRTVDQYVDRLDKFGIAAEPWQVVTSALATARYLKERFPEGGPVYLVGQDGIEKALLENGFSIQDKDVIAVVAGMDNYLTYQKLRTATLLLRAGAPFIGTNPDRTFPTPDGLTPGTGTILAALQTASDVEPTVIGKPKATMFEQAMAALGTSPDETLVVGDRLETDIAGGQAADCPVAVVLTGVATPAEAQAWQPKADFITADLASLVKKL